MLERVCIGIIDACDENGCIPRVRSLYTWNSAPPVAGYFASTCESAACYIYGREDDPSFCERLVLADG